MSLKPSQIATLLEMNRGRFDGIRKKSNSGLVQFETLLKVFLERYRLEDATTKEIKGALPLETPPFTSKSFFGSREMFVSNEISKEILENRTVAAVDGSQIYPSPEFMMSFGMVNISHFINRHVSDEAGYESISDPELVLPGGNVAFVNDAAVNYARTLGEITRTRDVVRQLAKSGEAAGKKDISFPVVYFDGSLILSFASHLSDKRRIGLVSAMVELLKESGRCSVPVCGYIDFSRARDLVSMASSSMGSNSMESNSMASSSMGSNSEASASKDSSINQTEPEPPSNPLPHLPNKPPDETEGGGSSEEPSQGIFDALVLNRMMEPVSRTSSFISCRDGILDEYGDLSRSLCFCYVKLNSGLPVRLEFPRWVSDAGFVDGLAAVSAAQCAVGNGYPYVLKRAHDGAVVTEQDRQRFLRIFSKFTEKSGLHQSFSAKAVAKSRK